MIWFNRQSKRPTDKLLEVISKAVEVIWYKVNVLEIKFLLQQQKHLKVIVYST